ncbi:MAG: TPM domain-containing protein [Proteobacteria bacterium]|nr:MAG: TPM domain-containing protein [Pseudomonadota bacterium]
MIFRILLMSFVVYSIAWSDELRSPVVDSARIFTNEQITQLTEKLVQLREKKDVYMVVITSQDAERSSIEEFAEAQFRKYEIGVDGKDNGLLFVIVPSHRKMRLEVGYGLEGDIPDNLARRIIDLARPDFRKGHYKEGIEEVIRLVSTIEFKPMKPGISAERFIRRNIPWIPFIGTWIFFLTFFAVVVGLITKESELTLALTRFFEGKDHAVWERHLLKHRGLKQAISLVRVLAITTTLLVAFPVIIYTPSVSASAALGTVCLILIVLLVATLYLMQSFQKINIDEIFSATPDDLKPALKALLDKLGIPPHPVSGVYSNSFRTGAGGGSSGGSSGGFSGGGSSGGGGASSSW